MDQIMNEETTWHKYSEYERFYIKETRYGLFTSVTESGEDMVTGLTYDIVLQATELHQMANAPDYDGRFDLCTHSSSVGVKL